MYKKIFFISLLFFCAMVTAQSENTQTIIDSIEIYKAYSRDKTTYKDNQRLFFAERARDLSVLIKNDSILIHANRRLSTVYWEVKQYDSFEKINRRNIVLSKKAGDSSSLAKANYKLGNLYRLHKLKTDSAYYYFSIAEKIYKLIDAKFNLAQSLHEIAKIQKNEKDFAGSELTSIEGLSLLDQLEATDSVNACKSYLYNNLGSVFNLQEQYEESIFYHKKALSLKINLKGDRRSTIDVSKNNLALANNNAGKYNLAKNYFSEILANKNLINNNPDFYALVLSNYAHTLYLSQDYKDLPSLYLKALKVCENIGGSKGSFRSISINQHLAEFYNDKGKKDSAKYYAYNAKEISEKYNTDDLLKALLLLSEIEEDSMALIHTKAYIKLSDSLQKRERNTRNKFARIQFETNQLLKETNRLDKQNGLILAIASILVLVLGLLYFIKVQRSKNKELLYQSEQEKANQELYKLMLTQQTKLEEGRLYERHRIAEELHDGILSRLFGTRMGMGFLKVKGDTKTIEDFNLFVNEMQGIEQDIRDVSHELKSEVLFSKSSFEAIVEQYLKSQSLIANFKYKIVNNAVVFKNLSENIRLEVYRIIQESVQNIIKHAKAKFVILEFSKKDDVLNITIQDDGVGFNTKGKYKGIGLKNISSRVLKLDGQFAIDSVQQKGTKLSINIPATNHE